MSIFTELKTLLEDYENDKKRVINNIELSLGYNDDFYDMLTRLYKKLSIFNEQD